MTQNEIALAIHTVLTSRPPHGTKTMDTQAWAEYHKQHAAFDEACEQLCQQMRQAENRDVFNVLFPLACSRFEPMSGMPAFAAHLLFYMKPACPISCTDAIRRVSQSEWDLSLEEVPWYLADFFGHSAIYQSLTILETEDSIKEVKEKQAVWDASHSHLRTFVEWKDVWKETAPGNEITRLDTIRYWLDIFIRDREDLLTKWEPFWRLHLKVAKLTAT